MTQPKHKFFVFYQALIFLVLVLVVAVMGMMAGSIYAHLTLAPTEDQAAGVALGVNNTLASGNTMCVNALKPSGQSGYGIFQRTDLFGPGSVEAPANHSVPHILTGIDPIIGPYFSFLAHKTDNGRNGESDHSRIEVKGPLGKKDETYTFTWRFFVPNTYKFTGNFTHLHQIKADGSGGSSPVIVLGGEYKNGSESFIVENLDDNDALLAKVSAAALKGKWLDVREQVTYGSSGSYELTIKTLDGSTVLQTGKVVTPLWRSKRTSMRPKWGIYRKHSDMLNSTEDQVWFANIAVTKGSNPTMDCRPAQAVSPVITSISPNSLRIGDRLVIKGSGFVPGQQYIVYENGFTASQVSAVSTVELAPVPLTAVTMMSYGPNNTIAVSGPGGRSNNMNFTLTK